MRIFNKPIVITYQGLLCEYTYIGTHDKVINPSPPPNHVSRVTPQHMIEKSDLRGYCGQNYTHSLMLPAFKFPSKLKDE